MLPSSTELAYFLEVANSLNLSRASERLGITQPTLSLAIKRLEKSVGTHLFIRHQHGVALTQAGKQLLLHARQLVQDWESARARALASHQEIQGHFTIGCHPAIAIYTVAKFLPELLEKHAKLEIQLKHDISRRITEKVISLSIDIGIVANPINHPDLVIVKLRDDEVTYWVGKGNSKIQNFHSGEGVILCDSELLQTQALMKTVKKNIKFSRVVNMNSLEVIANLTAKGCGIGILPECVAKSLYPDKLIRIPKAPVYRDQICLIYRNENRNIEAIKLMVEAIKRNIRV